MSKKVLYVDENMNIAITYLKNFTQSHPFIIWITVGFKQLFAAARGYTSNNCCYYEKSPDPYIPRYSSSEA